MSVYAVVCHAVQICGPAYMTHHLRSTSKRWRLLRQPAGHGPEDARLPSPSRHQGLPARELAPRCVRPTPGHGHPSQSCITTCHHHCMAAQKSESESEPSQAASQVDNREASRRFALRSPECNSGYRISMATQRACGYALNRPQPRSVICTSCGNHAGA